MVDLIIIIRQGNDHVHDLSLLYAFEEIFFHD